MDSFAPRAKDKFVASQQLEQLQSEVQRGPHYFLWAPHYQQVARKPNAPPLTTASQSDRRKMETDTAEVNYPVSSLGEYLLTNLKDNAVTCSHPIQVDAQTSESLTFSKFLQSSIRAAIGWKKLGLKCGDTVAVVCSNKLDLFPVVVGAIFEGITLMFVAAEGTEHEVRYCLSVVQPQAVVSEPSNHDTVRRASDPGALHVLAGCGGGGSTGSPSNQAVTVETLESWGAAEAAGEYQVASIADLHSHVAVVLFSSGSTGMPKAAAFSNHAIHFLISDPMGSWRDLIGPRLLLTSTLSWISGTVLSLHCMAAGSTAVLAKYTSEEYIIRMLEQHRVSSWFVPPPRLLLVCSCLDRMRPDLSSLKVVFASGGPLNAASQEQAGRALGASVLQMYASTETALLACDTVPPRYGSSGRCCAGAHLRIVDMNSDEDIKSPGVVGEVRARNIGAMKGFVGNPEATLAVRDEQGYFRTGDIGYLDQDGYLFITGRIKQLIKVKGLPVIPAEIEALLLSHPEVTEACVLGRPHPTLGELPAAFVVRAPNCNVTEEDLAQLVAERLSDFKRLWGGIYFLPDLPKTANGKIDLKKLREKLSSDEYQIRANGNAVDLS